MFAIEALYSTGNRQRNPIKINAPRLASRDRGHPCVMAETPPGSADDAARSDEQVSEIVAYRAVIDVAIGVLMEIHGVDADQAYGMLRSRSRERRLKVRRLAGRIVKDPSIAKDM